MDYDKLTQRKGDRKVPEVIEPPLRIGLVKTKRYLLKQNYYLDKDARDVMSSSEYPRVSRKTSILHIRNLDKQEWLVKANPVQPFGDRNVGDVGEGDEMKGGRTPLWYTSKKG